ncbi:prephenate dehydrogenase/arogenate dehydrogenase family protein [Halomarina salina]|uniref:Prephenate dehydrogenase/arogenate dehydrogenase family protein n=1 Tax=Halomarina salina TaxID=1872699 RepID=A0ABD5RS92_9EURY|nr:prephenate dehydrogenase/arogenate dehydrogenase family protein [Halomarina salina]
MHCCIVGAGEMGRWLGSTLAADPAFDVSFADTDPAAADSAASALGGEAVPLDPQESSRRFDAVALAVPIPAVAEAVATQAPRADRALLDVTGVMGTALDAMREHAPDRERLSLHPMFSEANAPGSIAAVHDAPGAVTDAVRESLDAAGNDLFDTTAADHDDAMETVQAKAHAAVLAYGLAGEAVDPRYHTDVSTAMFDLVANVTGGSAHVFGDIQTAFEGADAVAEAAERIDAARGDPEAFAALYEEAGRLGDAPTAEDEPEADEAGDAASESDG